MGCWRGFRRTHRATFCPVRLGGLPHIEYRGSFMILEDGIHIFLVMTWPNWRYLEEWSSSWKLSYSSCSWWMLSCSRSMLRLVVFWLLIILNRGGRENLLDVVDGCWSCRWGWCSSCRAHWLCRRRRGEKLLGVVDGDRGCRCGLGSSSCL